MVSLLINNNVVFTPSSDDLYNFVINISTGAISFEEIVEWLKKNTTGKK